MERRRRPRAVTLTLPDAKQPYLLFNGQKFTLRNFSDEGIGIWMPSDPPYGLNKGNRINGNVVIDNHIHAVQLEVVRHANRVMGFRIVQQSEELKVIFEKLLEPGSFSVDLKSHPVSGQYDKEMGKMRLWYLGRAGSELLIWFEQQTSMLTGVQVCWAGKWVLREHKKNIQTGQLRDLERYKGGTVVQLDELLVLDKNAEPQQVQQVAQFLMAVPPPLPGELLWQFVETEIELYFSGNFLKGISVA